ncbi:peptidylprolyl isomerase [Pasteurellaceae bacterium Macca]|nr:peptidylprolyl isomerase [Pasteurellaceae bacterium Macca]
MIGAMHEKTNSPAFKIIFALVSISFVLGGIGSSVLGGNTGAVKVNGDEISQQAFNLERGRQQNRLNAELGSKFWDLLDTPAYAEQFNRSIINKLVDDELLRQFSKELKLGISADQIKAEIVNTPSFQQGGKFDNKLYQQTLKQSGLSPDGYAAIVNEGMLLSQLQEGIINSDFNVPAQQELLAKLLLQKRNVRMAIFPVANEITNQTVTAEELKTYYDKHQANFVAPEKLTVEYVALTPKDIEKNINISPEQIETYYNTNKAQYETQTESHFAHIQVASEAEAQEIIQAVKNGEDFASLAKTKSQDSGSASQGGDLGWTKAGTFPADFETAANALSMGEVSAPVKVNGAFHIIRLLDRKVGGQIPLENVKNQITNTIREELTLTEYTRIAHEMANKAVENSGSLDAVAQLAGLTVQKTDAFTRENVPEALNKEPVIKALFEGDLRQTGQNSEALDLGDSTHPTTLFVRVSQYEAQRPQTFEEAKNKVENDVKTAKAEKTLTERVEQFASRLNKGENVQVNFGAPEETIFANAQLQDPVLTKAIFALAKPEGKANYLATRNANGDFVLVELNRVTDGDIESFKALAPQFAQADRLVLNQEMMNDLRQRAKIEVNEEFLEQLDSRSH